GQTRRQGGVGGARDVPDARQHRPLPGLPHRVPAGRRLRDGGAPRFGPDRAAGAGSAVPQQSARPGPAGETQVTGEPSSTCCACWEVIPAIATVLRRLLAPACTVTAPRATPSRSARNRTSSAFAAPSTGGAARRIFTASP